MGELTFQSVDNFCILAYFFESRQIELREESGGGEVESQRMELYSSISLTKDL